MCRIDKRLTTLCLDIFKGSDIAESGNDYFNTSHPNVLHSKPWSGILSLFMYSWSTDSRLTFHFLEKIWPWQLVIPWSKVSQILVKVKATHCPKFVNWLTCWSNLSRLTFDQHDNTWPSCSLVMNCECTSLGILFAWNTSKPLFTIMPICLGLSVKHMRDDCQMHVGCPTKVTHVA